MQRQMLHVELVLTRVVRNSRAPLHFVQIGRGGGLLVARAELASVISRFLRWASRVAVTLNQAPAGRYSREPVCMTEQVTFLTRSGQATTQSSPIGGDAFEPDQDGPDMMENTNLPA